MKENLDNLIKESMLAKTAVRTLLLRDIKAEFSKAETAKTSKKLDEISILKSMRKKRKDSIEQYIKANRMDLANIEKEEILILKEFLPEEISEDKLKELVTQIVNDLKESGCANMGSIMANVKNIPNVDMKLASSIIKSLI